MYNIIKNVINSGRYELEDMLTKIDTIWLQGNITDDERTDLIAIAREHCTPDMGYASLQDQITDLNTRVTALEQAGETGDTEEYPAWHKPTSSADAYYTGDKMTYTDGKRYICIAPDGYAVTYGPDALPAMWQEVE